MIVESWKQAVDATLPAAIESLGLNTQQSQTKKHLELRERLDKRILQDGRVEQILNQAKVRIFYCFV